MANTARFEQRLKDTYNRIRAFTIRETKASAEIQLPEKTIRNTEARLKPKQKKLYQDYRDELAAEILREGIETWDHAEDILKRLLRLVQVASNPKLVDQAYDEPPGKFEVLDTIMERKSPVDPKTLIWTSFRENVGTIASRYPYTQPAIVHGGLSIEERNTHLKRFIEDQECRLLIATPGAAKEGLTLTVANHAVFLDRSFSLDDYLQAQDRIHRISQTSDCLIENIVAKDTIDEWIGELLSAKELAANLVQGDITQSEYRKQATYNFNDLLQKILNPSGENK